MHVSHPRRILAVSLDAQADCLSGLIKDLTGSKPTTQESTSLAGITHEISLKTQYYTASVPIWLDLIASPSEWAASFLSDEAGEVLAVLGGVVLVFALPEPSSSPTTSKSPAASVELLTELIGQIGRVVNEGLGGWEWDGVRLAVGVGGADVDTEEWDELCAEAGMEFVRLGGSQPVKNEFGEKTGIARVKEALESNDWDLADAENVSDFGDFEGGSEDKKDHLDPDSLDFGFDPTDIENLKKAIFEADGQVDGGVEGDAAPQKDGTFGESEKTEKEKSDEMTKMEDMMRKLQAVREAGEGLPEAQRRRMAARAVQEVMKEL
ncbi:hypothetical protein E4U17_003456 [Claviceps sp. LM77 group G4]|nr:hypothetical protein E4U17_003456 [Claviceps sp. LM77 group G4]KAG6080599.1 hypothetical protein E4U16_000176 [Claviceps sp. LM84 group G4]KAG6085776.1 hypothetical protein E4U33_001111 [Claviceps sp. LM78 group G4]